MRPDMTMAFSVPFPGSAYQEIHSALARSLARGDGLVVLTGDSGVGKTTLWRSVVDETGAAASAILNPFLEFPDLLKQIVVDFGISPALSASEGQPHASAASEHDLIRAIQGFVEHTAQPVVVIVDDAHLMGRTVLSQIRALINLSTEIGGLTVLLVGQAPLERALSRREFRSIDERIAHRWRLGPLTRSEVAAYVAHCFSGLEPPPDDVFDSLAVMSEGIPVVLNRVVDAAMMADPASGRHQIDAGAVREAAAFIRADAIAARRRSVVSTVGVALASAGLAVSWLGASPWRAGGPGRLDGPGRRVSATSPSTSLNVRPQAVPTEDVQQPAPTDLGDPVVREGILRHASDLAAQGNVTALLDLRADVVAVRATLSPDLVAALLLDLDAQISDARLERLRLDGAAFRRFGR
jgi:type II secretory pathway predicted ATPase ExeA